MYLKNETDITSWKKEVYIHRTRAVRSFYWQWTDVGEKKCVNDVWQQASVTDPLRLQPRLIIYEFILHRWQRESIKSRSLKLYKKLLFPVLSLPSCSRASSLIVRYMWQMTQKRGICSHSSIQMVFPLDSTLRTASKVCTKLLSLHVFTSVTWLRCSINRQDTKELPAATIDLWGSDPLMCFSVLLLIKPSFASVQIYKAFFFQRC